MVRKRGFITLVKPSKSLQKNHAKILKKHISQGIALTQEELIRQLNPVVVGWSNYCIMKVFLVSHCLGLHEEETKHRDRT